MPEPPEVEAFRDRIEKINVMYTENGVRPKFQFQIFPHVFATGTDDKPYTTCTVNCEQYSDGTEPIDPAYVPDFWDSLRSADQPWEYLIKALASGEIYAEVRGKQLVIVCGHHTVTISFALESHLMGMKRRVFDELLHDCVPGPNSDRKKAELLRSFKIPADLIEENSSSSNRTVNIFAAWISKEYVWDLVDFARLVRFHILSRNRIWSKDDVCPTSPVWPTLWTAFVCGPDWVIEHEAAERTLDEWRESVQSQRRRSMKPIVDILCDTSVLAFSRFGRHCANDFLHLMGIYPGTPAYFICDSDDLYAEWKKEIPKYMGIWRSPKFLKHTAGICNTDNPFAFNYTSCNNYFGMYLKVFRRRTVKVPRDFYNRMVRQGFLDPNHVIGEPYVAMDEMLCVREHKYVTVYHRGGSLDSYTIIRAQPPKGWKVGPELKVEDVIFAGYATTIGIAEFRELKLNKIDFDHFTELKGKPGRKRKPNPTGFHGRPRKIQCIADIRKVGQTLSRTKTVVKPTGKENEDIVEEVGRQTRSQKRTKLAALTD